MALETARPLVIQDSTVDTALASDLSDEWLTKMEGQSLTSSDMQSTVILDIDDTQETAIPYLNAMVQFSRIVAKVWEILYGASTMSSMSAFGLDNYIEALLSRLQHDLPKKLQFDPREDFDAQLEGRTKWECQQTILLHMVCLVLPKV